MTKIEKGLREEIEDLRETIAKLRERIAVLEARPQYHNQPTIVPIPAYPLYPPYVVNTCRDLTPPGPWDHRRVGSLKHLASYQITC